MISEEAPMAPNTYSVSLGYRQRRVRLAWLAFLFCLSLSGCVRLGTEFQARDLPPGAPAPEDILHDLAANDAAIHTFRATGVFTLKSPELTATQLLRESAISFRTPSDLMVIGRKYGKQVFRLTCIGPEFIIEFPTEKQYYYRAEGERLEGLADTVSPVDIAREMFLPEIWSDLDPRQVRLTGFDPARGIASMEVLSAGLRRRPRRRLLLEGVPWVVRRSELLDRNGQVIATTVKDAYHEQGGVRFPTQVESAFPAQDALMRFDMRELFLNTALDDTQFDIGARTRFVAERRYEPMESPEPVKKKKRRR